MAKAPVSAELLKKKLSKEEIELRKQNEEILRGGSDQIEPPAHLTEGAKEIFEGIYSELQASGILGNIDVHMLATTSTALDRIKMLDIKFQQTDDLDEMGRIIRLQDVSMKQFYKGCQELCLSPSSRAKLSQMNVKAQEVKEDPLVQALKKYRGE